VLLQYQGCKTQGCGQWPPIKWISDIGLILKKIVIPAKAGTQRLPVFGDLHDGRSAFFTRMKMGSRFRGNDRFLLKKIFFRVSATSANPPRSLR
jgi:hypothetical protein